ncbi:MAG: ribonuclease HI [Candidatus Taylorbacteria bacterium]|nr:ribonuclease HI [Candidatus Taylorbacteria bacterium]
MKLLQIEEKKVVIFTDGSSRGNPGPGGYGVVAIYMDGHGEVCVDELGGREDMTTNNRMELKAVIEGLKNFIGYYANLKEYTFTIYLDSAYVENGITKWVSGWKKNGWKTGTKEDVKNQDLWMELDELKSKMNISLIRVPGHAGISGNERCDVIATMYADNLPVRLFTGRITSYPLDERNILELGTDSISLQKKKKSSSSVKAHSYVSLVDGKIHIDVDWKTCESRVKGKSGALFKKSTSPIDEKIIVEEFLKKNS